MIDKFPAFLAHLSSILGADRVHDASHLDGPGTEDAIRDLVGEDAIVVLPLKPAQVHITSEESLRNVFRRSTRISLEFLGYESPAHENVIVVLAPPSWLRIKPTPHDPHDFRVVAFMHAYNEEDVIGAAIDHLITSGVEVYVLDNHSTDRTAQIAAERIGKGVIAVETFPPGGDAGIHPLTRILGRFEALHHQLGANWYFINDADEIRRPPWMNQSMRDALWRVDQLGYTTIDFTVLNFPPVDNDFVSGTDFEQHFRHFEFGRNPGFFRQIKGWKNFGQPVDVATESGHEIRFEGAKVFPFKFLLQHYPLRSQAHAERKIFQERRSRRDPIFHARGRSIQYDRYQPGDSFLRDPADLLVFDLETFPTDYLIERLTGVGIERLPPAPPRPAPDFPADVLAAHDAAEAQFRAFERLHAADLRDLRSTLTAQVTSRQNEIDRLNAELSAIHRTRGWRVLQSWYALKRKLRG